MLLTAEHISKNYGIKQLIDDASLYQEEINSALSESTEQERAHFCAF